MPTCLSTLESNPVLTIAEGLDLILLSDDELLIQFGTRSRPSELLRDADLGGILGRITSKLLSRPRSVSELTNEIPGSIELLADLLEQGILSTTDRSPVDQYLRYTFSGMETTASAKIGLIGAGPLGAKIGASISATHPCELHSSAGAGAEQIESLIAANELTVVALEQPDLRTTHLVNRFAVRHHKPWLLATIDGNLGLIGPLFQPPDTACYNDFRTLSFAGTPNRVMARRHREHLAARVPSGFVGLPAYVDIVAGHASLAATHYLLRETCFALGRVMIIDFDRMQIDVEDVLKLPRCPVCGTTKSAYRPAFPVA